MDQRCVKPTLQRAARAAAVVLAIGWSGPRVAAQQSDDDADARRLIEVLRVGVGSFVADVGAGSGVLTVPTARHVGPEGRVYSTDINADRLEDIRDAARAASLENIVVIEGAPAQTNLPDECCDAVFMRFVYHHFGDPAAMNASLYRSLKSGGRLAVVDFPPRSGETAPAGRRGGGDAHGVTPATVIEELSAAGFARVRQLEWTTPGAFLVVAERPEPEHFSYTSRLPQRIGTWYAEVSSSHSGEMPCGSRLPGGAVRVEKASAAAWLAPPRSCYSS